MQVVPAEAKFWSDHARQQNEWQYPPILDELKERAKVLGLWNLFLPKEYPEGAGLTNLEYALMAEVTGRCSIAPEALNCSAPDTGNMEVLAKYGNAEQKQREWGVVGGVGCGRMREEGREGRRE